MTLKPHTPTRSAQRFRLARLAVTFGGLDRGISALVALIRVPLLVWGLELEQYGLYMAILGLVAAANLLDFGLHFSVLNQVAAARGRDDEASIRRTVATAFLIYGAIVVAGVSLILPGIRLVPLDALLGVDPSQVPLARRVVLLATASLLLPMPFKVFAAGLDGFQKQYTVSRYRSASSVAQLALLAAGVAIFRGQLLAVVAVTVVGELLHWIVLAFYAVRRQPELALHPGAASRAMAPALLSTGMMFLVTNLANLFKFALGSTIVSHGLGPAAVPSFSVPLALYMTGFSLASLVSASFWPAYGEAATRGDWPWVQRAFSFSARTAVGLGAFFAVLGALFGDVVIDLWIPRRIEPTQALLALFAVWLLAQTGVHAGSNLLAGLNRVRIVMVMALFEGISVVGLSLWLVGRMGGEAVAAAMAVSASVSAAFLLVYATPRGTEGRLCVPWGSFLRIAACSLLATAVGLLLRRGLAGTPPLTLLLAGAGLMAAVFGATAWRAVLSPDDRERIRAWTRRRLRGGPPTTAPPAASR